MTTTVGSPVVDAVVTLEILRPPSTRTTHTDTSGAFRFEMPGGTGEYLLAVAAPGYQYTRRRIGNDEGRATLVANVVVRPYTHVLSAVRVVAPPPPPPKPFEFAIGVGGTESAAGGTRAASDPALGTFQEALRTNLMVDASGLLGLPAAESQTQLNGLLYRGEGLPRATPVSIKAGVGDYDVAVGGFSGGRIAVDIMQAGEFAHRQGAVTVAQARGGPERLHGGTAPSDWPLVVVDAGGSSRFTERSGTSWGTRIARDSRPSVSLSTGDSSLLEEIGVAPQLLTRTESLGRARGLWGPTGVPNAAAWSNSAVVRIDPRITPHRTNALVLAVQHNESAPIVSSLLAAPAQARGQRAIDLTGQHLFRTLDARNAAWDIRTGVSFGERRHLTVGSAGAAATVLTQARNASSDTAFAPPLVLGGAGLAPRSNRATTEIHVQRERLSRGTRATQTKVFVSARTDAYRVGPRDRTALVELASLDALEQLDEGAVTVERASGALAMAYRQSVGGSRTWRVSDVLRVTTGVRADHQLVTAGGSASRARSLDVSPRVGLTWNFATPDEGPGYMESNLETRQLVPPGILRVGAGVFVADLAPDDAASPAGAARESSSVTCAFESPLTQQATTFEPGVLEAACLSEGPNGDLRILQSTSRLAAGYRPSRSMRATLSTVTRWWGWDVMLDGVVAYNDRQPVVWDLAVPRQPVAALASDGGRPLFAALSSFDAADGRLRPGRDINGANVGRALSVSSTGSSMLHRLALQVGTRNGRRLQMRGGYVWSRLVSRDAGWDSDAFTSPWILERGPSQGTSRHQWQLEVARSLFGVTASAWMRAASGTPFTPLVAGDVNGDGAALNDRAVIPAPASSAGYAALLDAAPGYARSCLMRNAGRVAPRGACTGPWSIRSAFHLSVDPGVYRGRQLADIAVVVDNLVPSAMRRPVDATLYRVQNVDHANGTFGLALNPSFGRRQVSAAGLGPRLTISVRVPLSRGIQRQQLDRWLATNGVGQRLSDDSLATLLARNVPNLYDGLLDDDGELGLLPSQRNVLLRRRAALHDELRRLWQAAARELVARKDPESSEALAIVQRATDGAWEASRLSANRLVEVITPVQEALLPGPANMLVRATEPIRMRIIYY